MSRLWDDLKKEFEWLKILQECYDESGTDHKTRQKHIRKIRERIKGLYPKDSLEKSLMEEEWRHIVAEDGEHGADYIIFKDCGETDDEIQEYVDNEIGYPPINSPYDCTGKPFTYDKHWKRTPAGIVIVHRWALDV